MNIAAVVHTYPLDALPYEIGFGLLAISMIWYSMVLRKMILIIHEKPVWLLPLVGALFILASVVMHAVAYLVFFPQLEAMNYVDEITQFSTFILQWRAWSLAGILIGGIFSLAGGGIYYRWTSR